MHPTNETDHKAAYIPTEEEIAEANEMDHKAAYMPTEEEIAEAAAILKAKHLAEKLRSP